MAEPADNPPPAPRRLTLTEQELFDRLGWFTRVRWFMAVCALLMLVVSWTMVGVRFRLPDGTVSLAPAVDVVLLIFLYNAAFTFLLHIVYQRRRAAMTRRKIRALALGQILCDMLAVCGLTHYTGGIENAFLILVCLPLVIASELLPKRFAYLTALGAAALVHGLAWGEQRGWIPHVYIEVGGRPIAGAGLYAHPVHVLHVTAALTGMMFATVFIASAIAVRLRERESELEAAYERLRRLDEAKGFFMRKAGHELRAPLAAIHSILDTILHQGGLAGEQARLMDRARRRTRALMELVQQLRRYAALRSPEALLARRPVALEELVEATVELFRRQAENASLLLTCHCDRVEVDGDEELLREVITNLLANAIQYTPPGGRVDVRLAVQADRAVLSVADSGIGISEEARRRLFEEFYRAPEARRHFPDGTGLGLSITRRIARMHGGDIEVASRPGAGSVFSVWLPLRPREADPPAAEG